VGEGAEEEEMAVVTTEEAVAEAAAEDPTSQAQGRTCQVSKATPMA
jgi:hypothetical protein